MPEINVNQMASTLWLQLKKLKGRSEDKSIYHFGITEQALQITTNLKPKSPELLAPDNSELLLKLSSCTGAIPVERYSIKPITFDDFDLMDKYFVQYEYDFRKMFDRLYQAYYEGAAGLPAFKDGKIFRGMKNVFLKFKEYNYRQIRLFEGIDQIARLLGAKEEPGDKREYITPEADRLVQVTE